MESNNTLSLLLAKKLSVRSGANYGNNFLRSLTMGRTVLLYGVHTHLLLFIKSCNIIKMKDDNTYQKV